MYQRDNPGTGGPPVEPRNETVPGLPHILRKRIQRAIEAFPGTRHTLRRPERPAGILEELWGSLGSPFAVT